MLEAPQHAPQKNPLRLNSMAICSPPGLCFARHQLRCRDDCPWLLVCCECAPRRRPDLNGSLLRRWPHVGPFMPQRQYRAPLLRKPDLQRFDRMNPLRANHHRVVAATTPLASVGVRKLWHWSPLPALVVIRLMLALDLAFSQPICSSCFRAAGCTLARRNRWLERLCQTRQDRCCRSSIRPQRCCRGFIRPARCSSAGSSVPTGGR
jgi:hypothetical protein